jgi:hypothetical protein
MNAVAEPVAKEPEKTGADNQLNSPNLGKDGKPKQRAITNAKQAYGIFKSIRDRALTARIKTAAIIAEAYGGAPPYRTSDLERSGQGWRNNFSTNFLASIIDRVVPQLNEPLTSTPLLAHKALPPDAKEGARKSRKFNEVFTRKVRAWPEWKDHLRGLAQEVCLHGNAVVSRIDDNWRPKVWRYDEVFLPEGTGQHAGKVQFAAFGQTFLMHEFMALFEDQKLAELAGYNIKGCIATANSAAGFKGEETPLEMQDAMREQSPMGFSYASENQMRTVRAAHILVRDYSGEVDLWTVSQDEGNEIRQSKGHHAEMKDCITLFTMQTGNRKFYGSKGLGRLLTNLHMAIERHRNVTGDKITFSGYPVVKSEDPTNVQLQLRYPFFVAPIEVQILVEKFDVNWEASEGLDQKLVSIAESIAGAFIPPQVDQAGSSKTKIEAAQKAERDIAVRQGVLSRYADQCKDMLDMMCRAMFNADALREGKRVYEDKKKKQANSVIVVLRAAWRLLKKAFGNKKLEVEPVLETKLADEEAVAAVCELMDAGLTIEEIALLAVTPSSENNEDEGATKDNETLQYLGLNKASPYIDQRRAAEMEAHIILGPARAKDLLIPEDDPNVRDTAIWQQTIETSEMIDGNPIPALATHNHVIHRQALAPNLEGIVEAITTQPPTPELIKGAKLMLQHYAQHLALDTVTPPEEKKQEEQQIRAMGQTVDKIEAELKKAAEAIIAAGGPEAVAGGGAAPGTPPAAPEGGAPADPTTELQVASDIALKTKAVAQKDRELTLQERKQQHAEETKAIELQQENVRIIDAAAAREQAQAQALDDAERDRAVTATKV